MYVYGQEIRCYSNNKEIKKYKIQNLNKKMFTTFWFSESGVLQKRNPVNSLIAI